MNYQTLTLFMPLLGAAYGVGLGMYIRSSEKTRKKKRLLVASGILLLLVCVFTLVNAFHK